ncbi:MAG: endonuclease/exonuclease/phosphatase family protein [Pseudomonadota bacterium]
MPGVATTASECVAALRGSPSDVGQGLATPIELLSWNVQKGRQANWRADLRELSDGKAFVALQELVLEAGVAADLPHLAYMAFSQGYTTRTKTTGVATFSAKPPLAECRLSAVEPLLRTPKATSIAEYALQAHAQTLLVVNLHAVNFTLGLKEFATQIEQIREVLEAHDGPAVLGGDFNTWSRRRMRIVDALVDDLGFSDVPLAKDSRKTFNGNPLDHVFTRGFSTVSARSTVVRSSDHNPVAVELTL